MLNFRLAYAPNEECKDKNLTTVREIERSGYNIINATVPGSFEMDFMREKILFGRYSGNSKIRDLSFLVFYRV